MKIEKINDSQIKCTLTKADLDNRNLKLSELAYGSKEANNLFREMTEQANRKYGFNFSDTPIMIEAVPLPNDSVILFLTKVNDPEELDTRFSKFSHTPEDYDDAAQMEKHINSNAPKGANEILNLLDSFKKSLTDASQQLNTLNSQNEKTDAEANKSTIDNSTGNNHSNITIIFEFTSIDNIIALSKVLVGKYNGVNTLYYNSESNIFYLIMEQSDHTPEEFNQICNITSEYGELSNFNYESVFYIQEHYELLSKSTALSVFAKV